jgi:hypothetical protein
MRWSAILALALLPGVPTAQLPADAVARTRSMLHDVCTALAAPCHTCGRPSPGPSPTPRPAHDPLRRPVDAWGRALQIAVGGAGVTLRSAGADGELGTADDVVERCGSAP